MANPTEGDNIMVHQDLDDDNVVVPGSSSTGNGMAASAGTAGGAADTTNFNVPVNSGSQNISEAKARLQSQPLILSGDWRIWQNLTDRPMRKCITTSQTRSEIWLMNSFHPWWTWTTRDLINFFCQNLRISLNKNTWSR